MGKKQMKVLKKIKKIFIAMWVALIGFSTKILAASENFNIFEMNGTEYAPPKSPQIGETILNTSKFIIAPIVLIIGLIMYLNKKSSEKVKKVGEVLMVIAIIIIVIGILYTYFCNVYIES